jgi:hypothetical protein
MGPSVDGTGKRQVLLVAEADLRPLHLAAHNRVYSTKLDSYLVVYAHAGGTPERQETQIDVSVPEASWAQVEQGGLPVRREVALAPGLYQARLLLKDQGGLIGSVTHEIEVPALGGLQVTTPVLTDVLQGGGAGQAPRPVPAAHRVFKAGAVVACAFSVLGASPDAAGVPKVTIGYTLRRASGPVVSEVPARQLVPGAGGQLSPVIFLKLPADAAGEHEVALTIRDEVRGTTLEVVEPFTIVRP